MDVVILGFSIAGVTVAQELRKLEPDPEKLKISIYGREPYGFYARIRIPEVFGGTVGAEDLNIHKDSWYAERSIATFTNKEAVSIDRKASRLRFKDGQEIGYDALVLALGADPALPNIPGIRLAGLRSVREFSDADWVRQWIGEGARSMAVVGGGLLGLEAARHLAGTSLESVTVLEVAPSLLPRQLDAGAAAILKGRIEAMGIKTRTGVQVEAFEGHSSLEGIRLKDGELLSVDGALLSMGIVPRTGLAKEAGLETKRGIVVDEGLRSSDPAIWAVGDCAEFQGIVWGIIPAAMEQAPVAAASILKREGPLYRQTVPRTTLKVLGIDLMSAGKAVMTAEEEGQYETLVREDQASGRYEKFVLKDGLLSGAILLGSKQNQSWCMKQLGKPVAREEIPPLE